MKLNSIIFHTTRLNEIRSFYEGKLKFKLGTYEKDGKEFPDCAETWANYDMGGSLLCFEADDSRTDAGTIVVHTKNFLSTRHMLNSVGINIVESSDHWIKIKDPEGRSIIIEPVV